MSRFEIKVENREASTAQAETERHIFIDYKCETNNWYSFLAFYVIGTALLVFFVFNPIVKRLGDSGYIRLPK